MTDETSYERSVGRGWDALSQDGVQKVIAAYTAIDQLTAALRLFEHVMDTCEKACIAKAFETDPNNIDVQKVLGRWMSDVRLMKSTFGALDGAGKTLVSVTRWVVTDRTDEAADR